MRGEKRAEKIVVVFLVAFGLYFNFSSDKANVTEHTSSVISLQIDETIGGKH